MIRRSHPDADVTVKPTHGFLLRLVMRTPGIRDTLFSHDLAI
jgi:hypothetical protein